MQNPAVPAVCGTHDGRQATWVNRTPLGVELHLDKGGEQFWWLPVLFSLINSQKHQWAAHMLLMQGAWFG